MFIYVLRLLFQRKIKVWTSSIWIFHFSNKLWMYLRCTCTCLKLSIYSYIAFEFGSMFWFCLFALIHRCVVQLLHSERCCCEGALCHFYRDSGNLSDLSDERSASHITHSAPEAAAEEYSCWINSSTTASVTVIQLFIQLTINATGRHSKQPSVHLFYKQFATEPDINQ